MASIRSEKLVQVPAEQAWAALRDTANPHRLFAGVLTDASIDDDVRTVTFANGMVARERIVDIDDRRRRMAYSVQDMFEHHSASMQIYPEGATRCRFVWIADLLPNDKATMVAQLMEQGSQALVHNLEANLVAARG
jgi:Polyketide cyclase / dehydrase and lipid transport